MSEEPRIIIKVTNWQTAQRQYWRHVANRACLAILADQREPVLTARQGSTDPTRPPHAPPSNMEGSDLYRVRVEPIEIMLPGKKIITERFDFDLRTTPLPEGPAKQLETLLHWPTPESTEPLFRYRAQHQILERRSGLSGDMVWLFEALLWPHAEEMLWAMS